MADISTELAAIESANFGEELRTPVGSALGKINQEISAHTDLINNDIFHRCYYRGASLGSGATFEQASTPEQRTAIQNGSFSDMFIGDYWTIDSKIFRIADFNYWKYIGDTSFTQNHLVIVPDEIMGSGKMNSTNITTGAYVGSEMNTDENSTLNTARATIASLFGSYLGTHKSYLANTVTDGAESAGAFVESSVDLMSEIMVYGCNIRKKTISNTYLATSDKTQLALFRLNPSLIQHKRQYWWLRDVVSGTSFAVVHYRGNASDGGASYSAGVRPAFPLVVPSE